MVAIPTPSELIVHVLADDWCATGRQDAIAQLAAIFARLSGLPDARELVLSAMQREESEPTYLGRGMALPHARVAGLTRAGVCVAHASAGIPWQDERARLIIFLAVPEERPELYLHLMSRLVRWRLRLPDSELLQPCIPADDWANALRGELAC